MQNYEKAAIFELQRYLSDISLAGGRIPRVLPDGIYDDATEEAVRELQRLYGIPVTGEVDRLTWEAVYELWLASSEDRRKSRAIYPFEMLLSGGEVGRGEAHELVYIIQIMLDVVDRAYDFDLPTPINGNYGEETHRNVMQFQRIHQLPETGIVDRATWDRLASAYNEHIYEN